MPHLAPFLVVLISVSWHAPTARAQSPPPKATARREDAKLIRCDVCRHLAASAWRQSAGVASEDDLIELTERLTTAWRPQGEWIASLHLEVGLGRRLKVKDMKKQGECGEACKTIEKAAQMVMGEHDTDIAEALFTVRIYCFRPLVAVVSRHVTAIGCFYAEHGMVYSFLKRLTTVQRRYTSEKAFERWVCDDLTKACSSRTAAVVPSDHVPYPPFKPMAQGAENLERMMGEMEDQGLKGKMWSREDLMDRYGEEMQRMQMDEL
jgi:hypothetical protein